MFRITREPSSGSYIQCLAKIIVIFAKHCIKLPDDGSLVIRNTLGQFIIFYNNSNFMYELYI